MTSAPKFLEPPEVFVAPPVPLIRERFAPPPWAPQYDANFISFKVYKNK